METEGDYKRSLKAAIYGLWSSKFGYDDFASHMEAAISRGLTLAFREGFKLVGIDPDEMDQAEMLALDNIITQELMYVQNLGDDIIFSRNQSFKHLQGRVDSWSEKYEEVRLRARMMADLNGKYLWVLDPICKHCDSCLSLEGKVKRGSTWDTSGVYPRSPKLKCFVGCGCKLEKTTKPLSRGSLASL